VGRKGNAAELPRRFLIVGLIPDKRFSRGRFRFHGPLDRKISSCAVSWCNRAGRSDCHTSGAACALQRRARIHGYYAHDGSVYSKLEAARVFVPRRDLYHNRHALVIPALAAAKIASLVKARESTGTVARRAAGTLFFGLGVKLAVSN
jgi:hypothetical protein